MERSHAASQHRVTLRLFESCLLSMWCSCLISRLLAIPSWLCTATCANSTWTSASDSCKRCCMPCSSPCNYRGQHKAFNNTMDAQAALRCRCMSCSWSCSSPCSCRQQQQPGFDGCMRFSRLCQQPSASFERCCMPCSLQSRMQRSQLRALCERCRCEDSLPTGAGSATCPSDAQTQDQVALRERMWMHRLP